MCMCIIFVYAHKLCVCVHINIGVCLCMSVSISLYLCIECEFVCVQLTSSLPPPSLSYPPSLLPFLSPLPPSLPPSLCADDECPQKRRDSQIQDDDDHGDKENNFLLNYFY